jgi:hypothetical protein
MSEVQYIQYGALGLCFFILYWIGQKMDKISEALNKLSVAIATCPLKKEGKPA